MNRIQELSNPVFSMATRSGKIRISRFRPQGKIFVFAMYLIPRGGGGVDYEFLSGEVPLGPWNP